MLNVKKVNLFPIRDVVLNSIEDLGFSLIATNSRNQAKGFIGRYISSGYFLKIYQLSESIDQISMEQFVDEISQSEIHSNSQDIIIAFNKDFFVTKIAANKPSMIGETLAIAESESYLNLKSKVCKIQGDRNLNEQNSDELASILETNGKNIVKFFIEKLNYNLSDKVRTKIGEVIIFGEINNSNKDIAFIDLTSHSVDITKPAGARIAYNLMIEVIEEIHLKQAKPSLAFIRSGEGLILVSHARSRDQKIQLHPNRLRENGWVRSNLLSLSANKIATNQYGDIDIDQVLNTKELDKEFHDLCQDFRLCLMEDVLNNANYCRDLTTIISVIDPGQKKMSSENFLKKMGKDHKLQNLYLAICDGLVLRTLIHRFIEVYHGVPFSRKYDDLLNKFSTDHIAQRGEYGYKQKGCVQRFQNSKKLKPLSAEAFKKEVLMLDDEYSSKYGGDVHYSLVARGTRKLEEIIGPEYLCELLDLTNEKRYSFKYEDLRPDALENYYQRSLETSLSFIVKDKKNSVCIDQSGQARKDLGAYFTPAEVSRFVVTNTLVKKLDELEVKIKHNRNNQLAFELFNQYVNLKIVDPTVGGGSFLKEAFRAYTTPKRKRFIETWLKQATDLQKRELKKRYSWVESKTNDFEEHVLTKCLFGVDLDIKALSVASQTLTLEALHYLDGEEKFPSFINFNLKCGNAFVSWVGEEWRNFSPTVITEILRLRKLDNRVLNHGELESLISRERSLISGELSLHKNKSLLDIDPLTPFCWQLEFPEIFFNTDGTPKNDPGFDVVLGNPPWEVLKPDEEDFIKRNGGIIPKGKNSRQDFEKYFKKFISNDEMNLLFENYWQFRSLSSDYINKFKHYSLLEPKYEEVGGGNGDVNTYKLASELYINLIKAKGYFGFIVPDGLLGDKGTRDLRNNLVNNGLSEVVSFNKANDVFPDATQAFVIVSGKKADDLDGFVSYMGLSQKNSLNQFKEKSVFYKKDFFNQFPLETKPVMSFRSNEELKIVTKYLTHRPLIEHSDGAITPYRELDTTNDFYLTKGGGTPGYKVCKGENIDRYVAPTGDLYNLDYKKLQSEKKWSNSLNQIRIAWRDIAGLNDARRMYACYIPKKVCCFNSLNVIKGFETSEQAYFYIAILNSFCYEFLIRLQSKNNHINIYLVKLNPLPEFNGSKEDLLISKLSLQLAHGKKNTNDEAVLEALIAKKYGFSPNEFELIVNSFKKIDSNFINQTIKKAA